MLRAVYRLSRNVCKGTFNYLCNKLSAPVVVLLYHRVTSLPHDPQLLAVSPENFREQVRFLKKFPILRFEDDWSRVREPSLVITFDDGYADNCVQALPILDELGVPATFFVNTGNLNNDQEYWWDELERLILADRSFPEEFVLTDCEWKMKNIWPTATMTDRSKLYTNLHQLILKSRDRNFCIRVIRQLRQWSGLGDHGRESHRPMSYAELRTMAANPLVTIGAHGVSHLPFPVMSEEQQFLEINECKNRLEAWTDRRITAFSYPFGTRKDYTATTIRLLQEAGFSKSAANFQGQYRTGTDPFQIPRQLVRNWDMESFEKNMNRFWIL